jgi:hypothetical protein
LPQQHHPKALRARAIAEPIVKPRPFVDDVCGEMQKGNTTVIHYPWDDFMTAQR